VEFEGSQLVHALSLEVAHQEDLLQLLLLLVLLLLLLVLLLLWLLLLLV
jgi:hypothetical protein